MYCQISPSTKSRQNQNDWLGEIIYIALVVLQPTNFIRNKHTKPFVCLFQNHFPQTNVPYHSIIIINRERYTYNHLYDWKQTSCHFRPKRIYIRWIFISFTHVSPFHLNSIDHAHRLESSYPSSWFDNNPINQLVTWYPSKCYHDQIWHTIYRIWSAYMVIPYSISMGMIFLSVKDNYIDYYYNQYLHSKFQSEIIWKYNYD